jgi:hypothetical protein
VPSFDARETGNNSMIPVPLKCAASESFVPGGGVSVRSTKVQAKVADLAAIKEVVIHYKQSDSTWTNAVVTGQKDFGDYVLFAENFNSFVTDRFVLRFSAAGQTFWDNNFGRNYTLSKVDGSMVE